MKSRRRSVVMALVLTASFLPLPSANAVTLNFTLETWSDNSIVSFEYDESIPTPAAIKSQILQNCKTEMADIQLGAKARAVNQNNATVGLGKVTKVSVGKIYKGFQPGWTNEENADPESWLSRFTRYFDYDGDNPNSVSTVYFAPCIFSGSITNLRTSSFYRFYIGDFRTEEYDSNELRLKKWRLNFIDYSLGCDNYYEFDKLKGCEF